jgi:hypothetical protein
MEPRAAYSAVIRQYDVVVWLRHTERSKALSLSEGDKVVFSGIVGAQHWNAISVHLNDGEIVSLSMPSSEILGASAGNRVESILHGAQ